MGRYENRTGLAESHGISPPTVDAWIRAGMPVVQHGGRGKEWKFDNVAVRDWLIEKKVKEAAGAPSTDIEEARRRKLSAEAEMAELELAKAKGDVALISEFAQAHAKRMAIIRTNIMSVPQRAVLQLLGETNETAFKTKLRAELVIALTQAANTDIDWDEADPDE